MSEIENARRTIAKCEEVLQECEKFFYHQAHMNAAGHLSERVMYSPIHSAIGSALNGITMFNGAFPSDPDA